MSQRITRHMTRVPRAKVDDEAELEVKRPEKNSIHAADCQPLSKKGSLSLRLPLIQPSALAESTASESRAEEGGFSTDRYVG